MREKPNSNRPAIWSEGSQRPPFDFRAFLRGSLYFARLDLASWLGRGSRALGAFSAELLQGRWRIPEHRLGRTGRYLPRVEAVGAAFAGGAELLRRSGLRIAPLAEEEELQETATFSLHVPLAAPVVAPVVPVVTPERPTWGADHLSDAAATNVNTQGQADELAAIRAFMHLEEPDVAQPQADHLPSGVAAAGYSHPTGTTGGAVKNLFLRTVSPILAFGLTGVVLPWGVVRAGIAHASGEDLRQI